jgi:transcription elongation factor Elf1
MAELTFRCPTNGFEIESGIETDPDTRSQIRFFTLRLLCPACGQAHEFKIGEAMTEIDRQRQHQP